jgi:hypothetical protein
MHPARKLVMDFLRDLAYDNMVNSISATRLIPTQQQSIVDTILTQSLPLVDTGNLKRHQEFTTEMLKTITDHLLATDLFNETTNKPSNAGFGSAASLQNLFNLIDRLVDKLWEGLYRRDPKEVFEMIAKIIGCIKKRFQTVSLEQLINSMNRTLLYQLSRPCHSLTEQLEILDVLHKMTKMKQLIFASSNYQAEFFACVTHCLLQITQKNEGENERIDANASMIGSGVQSKTQWYTQALFSDTFTASVDDQAAVNNNPHHQHNMNAKYLLVSAAQRVWLDLYLNKKSQLEECLKVSLDSIGKNPTLGELRIVLTEPCGKCWTQFVETNYGANRLPIADKIQSQLQAKLQRVVTGGISTMAGGFNRVVSMKKQKKEVARLTWRELLDTTNSVLVNLLAVKDFMDADVRRFFRQNEQRHSYLHDEWLKIEKDVLLREKALWGDDKESELNKFKLDFTEGPNRQRKRLLNNNDEFYRNYPYRPELEAVKPSKKYKTPSSAHSRDYYKQFRVKCLLMFGESLQQFLQEQARYAVLEQQYGAIANQMMSSEQAANEIDQQLQSLAILTQQQSIESIMTISSNKSMLF